MAHRARTGGANGSMAAVAEGDARQKFRCSMLGRSGGMPSGEFHPRSIYAQGNRLFAILREAAGNFFSAMPSLLHTNGKA
jgi:hypothetical protein